MMFIALALTALVQAPPTQSTDKIARTIIADRGGFQAVRVTFAPRAAVTPGPQAYDLVIVPIDAGMSAEVDGKPVGWRPGVTILIPRGAPHRVWNASGAPVTFISVRRLADAQIKAPPAPQTSAVTIAARQTANTCAQRRCDSSATANCAARQRPILGRRSSCSLATETFE